jgi:hypothetical protein
MAQDFLSQLFGGQPDYSQFMSPQQSEQSQNNALTSAGLSAAIALLGASGQTNRPVSTGQALGSALSAGLGGYQSSFDNQLRQILAQGQLSDLQDKRILREQTIKESRLKETQAQQLAQALAIEDPQQKIDALRAIGRFDLVKELAQGQTAIRQSGLLRPVGEAEAPSPFAPYLTSQSPEVRIQAQQFDQGFKTGRITEDMVDRLTPALATMQAGFNQQLESRADRLSREAIARGERADKRLEGKKPTESEQKAYGFAQRMELSDQLITNLENQVLTEGKDATALYPTATSQAASKVPLIGDYLRTQVTSPIQQQYRQAQENWVRANLRKESGAVIGSDEMADEIRTYFPQPGESAQVIQQKQLARQVTQDAMKTSAGAIYRPFNLDEFVKKNRIDK